MDHSLAEEERFSRLDWLQFRLNLCQEGLVENGKEKFLTLRESMKWYEGEVVKAALTKTSGHRSKAAALLGISRKTLWEKIKYHKIRHNEVENQDAKSTQ